MRRRGAALAAALAVTACSSGATGPAGPPTTRQDFSRALLTYDTLPPGYFVTADDTFIRTTGPSARQGLLDGFTVPVGPPTATSPPQCGTSTPFDEPDPVALVVALDHTTQIILVQAAGPSGADLAGLAQSVAACPHASFGRLTSTSRVLPAPEVQADAAIALGFDLTREERGSSRRASQVVALAAVGPVLVGVWAIAEGRDVDPAVVSDALVSAVGAARDVAG